MADITVVKRSRTASKGWIKRAARALESVLSTHPADKFDLEAAMADFDSRLAALDEVQSSLLLFKV